MEVVKQRREMDQLKARITTMTDQSGIHVDDGLQGDLETIMKEMTKRIREDCKEDSFRRVFWGQQLHALAATDRRQLRWHPALIKWCLNLKLRSSSSYRALRKSGVLVLPSERTLRDYTHWIESGSGFMAKVDQQLIETAKVNTIPEFQKCVCLIFDAVKVKEDLVYDKNLFQIIGFIDVGDLNNRLLALERAEMGEQYRSVASNILVFMVRGLFSDLQFPYAQFPCASLSADIIFPLVWDCIKRLETCGFKVLACTADGASCNRKFFKMNNPAAPLAYKTVNVFSDEKRPDFFFSDVPHLIKTVRNCWANSFGHINARALKV